MLKVFSGIWLLDCINLIKYNGVDVFDSILDIPYNTWGIYWLIIILVIIVLATIKTLLDSK